MEAWKKQNNLNPRFMKDRSKNLTRVGNGASFEVDEYLSQKCIPESDDVLTYWKRY